MRTICFVSVLFFCPITFLSGCSRASEDKSREIPKVSKTPETPETSLDKKEKKAVRKPLKPLTLPEGDFSVGFSSKSLRARQKAIPLNNRGKNFQKRQNYAKAEEFFRKALDLDPEYSPAAYRLSQSLMQLGHYNDAAQMYFRAIQLDYMTYAKKFNNWSSLPELADSEYLPQVKAGMELVRSRWTDRLSESGIFLLVKKPKKSPENAAEPESELPDQGFLFFLNLNTQHALELNIQTQSAGFLHDVRGKRLLILSLERINPETDLMPLTLSGISLTLLDLTTLESSTITIPGQATTVTVFSKDNRFFIMHTAYEETAESETRIVSRIEENTAVKIIETPSPKTPVDLSERKASQPDLASFCKKRYEGMKQLKDVLRIDHICGSRFPFDSKCINTGKNIRLCKEEQKESKTSSIVIYSGNKKTVLAENFSILQMHPKK